MRLKAVALVAACVALPVTAGHAEPDIWTTTTSYSGVRTVTDGSGQSIAGPYYFSPKMQRWDMSMGGQKVTLIVRKDQGKAYTVMHAQKMYAAAAGEQDALTTRPPDKGTATITEVGRETVNGEEAVKYRVVFKDEGESATGFIWVARGNIHVKMTINQIVKGKRSTMTMNLTGLKRGSQDPTLFEPPAGYRRIGPK